MAKIISPLTGTLQSIKKQFISKEKLLKSTLNVQKKRIALNRSNAERERFIDYEKVLEKPLRFLGRGIKSVVGKRLGFLDTLKTFIVNLLLGFIALRLLKYLPQLIQFAKTALKVGNFILDIGGKILNGLVTFVDYGYQAYDHARKIVGKIGGEKAVANLDKATGESTKVMNQLFIAAMLFSDFSPFASMGSAPSIFNKSVDAIKDKVSGEVASAASNAATNAAGKAALGPLATAGVVAGAGLLLSAAGEGVFQLTKWTRGLMGFGPISKFFQVPLGILEGVGTIFDILGAPFRYGIELIRAGFMKMFNMKDGLEKQAKNLGKFDARVRENIRRFAGVFAPVFTFFGQNETAKKLATPGSFGSLYGKKAVKDMGYSGGGKVISVRKYASGGPVNIPRTEVKEVDIPGGETTKQEPTRPGASIGGEERFAEVFPDSGGDAYKMNRYGYMINSYDTISGIPDLGSIFALTTKTLLGDIVTKDDYDRASGSLSSFMLRGLYETNPGAYEKFSSLINIKQFNRAISGFLMKSMSIPLGGIINLLKIQVGLIPKPGEDVDTTKPGDMSSGSDSDMVEGSVSGGQLTMEQLVGLAKGAGFSDGDAVIMAAIAKGESGGNSNAKNFKPPDKSYGLWQINMIDPLGPARMKEFGLQREDQLFDPVTNAKAAFAIRKSQGLSAWTIYKNGAYKNHLAAARAAKDAPSLSTSPIPTKIKPVSLSPSANQPAGGHIVTSEMGMRRLALSPGMHMGVDISGNTGEHLKAFTDGTIEDVGWDGGYGNYVNWIDSSGIAHFYAHMNKPAFVRKGQKVKKGTVLGELGSTGTSSGPHLHWEASTNPKDTGRSKSAVLSRFNPLSRYSKESPFAGRESGGSTLSGGIRQLHKGEYVIDKDSVDLFGGNSFFSMINGVENKKQRSEKSSQLIQHLSKYTGRKIDQRPEMIVENSDTIIIQGPPTYIESGSSRGSSGGGSSNYDQYATLDLRA